MRNRAACQPELLQPDQQGALQPGERPKPQRQSFAIARCKALGLATPAVVTLGGEGLLQGEQGRVGGAEQFAPAGLLPA